MNFNRLKQVFTFGRRLGMLFAAAGSILGGAWLAFYAVSPGAAERVGPSLLVTVLALLLLPGAALAAWGWDRMRSSD